MPHSPSDATESILGFYFQGQYALLLLWDGEDDDDTIALETEDDVVFEGGGEIVLSQLKHSRGNPPPLSVKNDGLWKAINNWVRGAPATNGADTGNVGPVPSRIYSFVTAARIADESPLHTAVPGADRSPEAVARLVATFVDEAERVRDARAAAEHAGTPLPYHDRANGCASFLSLTPERRARLVGRLRVLPGLFPITEVEAKVIRLLSTTVPKHQRSAVAERLMEWWDRQVARALIGNRDRRIIKRELVAKLNALIREHGPDSLPDDYSLRKPAPEDLAEGRGGMIERQIRLVRGGEARIDNALVAWWRAQSQRVRWIDLDVSVAPDLQAFDERLKEAWAQQHGPMCDDCEGLPEDSRCQHGLEILKWALLRAADEVVPPRPEWRHPFYAQGTLQQLAHLLEVGWHPEYQIHLRPAAEEEDDAPPSPKRGRGRSPRVSRKVEAR
jgi:hypothetical protein